MESLDLLGGESLHKPVLTAEVAQDIRNLLPERLQSHSEWSLSFSLERDGAALSTLYAKCAPKHGAHRPSSGYILAVKDSAGGVFGAYLNDSLHPSDGTVRYYGNGDCFLWRSLRNSDGSTRLEAFLYTGLNDFIIFCTPHFISIGGGNGSYGIWLDDSLEKGISEKTETFGNVPLSSVGSRFNVVSVELWHV